MKNLAEKITYRSYSIEVIKQGSAYMYKVYDPKGEFEISVGGRKSVEDAIEYAKKHVDLSIAVLKSFKI